jgi:hypothetical protein
MFSAGNAVVPLAEENHARMTYQRLNNGDASKNYKRKMASLSSAQNRKVRQKMAMFAQGSENLA